jgi:DNA-3-methyladenine glycosylase II
VSGKLDLEPFANLSNEEAMSRLLDLSGVGRWTAEYILLRGMGRIDSFPGDDIGARNNLARWLRLRKPLNYGRVMRVVDRWKPDSGLIYFICCWMGLSAPGISERKLPQRISSPLERRNGPVIGGLEK